jgi:hypothetical protein
MTLDQCVRGLAFEVERGAASYSQERVDVLIISYIRGGDFTETEQRRHYLADAFKIAVLPSPERRRILDRILGIPEPIAR